MLFLFGGVLAGGAGLVEAAAVFGLDLGMLGAGILVPEIHGVLAAPVFFGLLANERSTERDPECVLFFLST